MNKPVDRVDTSGAEHVRDVAVRHHHQMVGEFERRYVEMEHDYFSSAFSYGRKKIDRLLDKELAALDPGSKVLDIGCGTGIYLPIVARHGHDAAGVEPAAGMRQSALDAHPDAAVRDGVATELPFADQHFDLVFAIEVFRYLDDSDVQQAYAEAWRVLKPGGRFFFTMVNRDALDGFWLMQRVRERLTDDRINDDHPHCEFVTPRQVVADLQQAGFADIQCEGRLFAPIRIVYKVSDRLGRSVAPHVEELDDRVSSSPRMSRFAGHLVCTATKPST